MEEYSGHEMNPPYPPPVDQLLTLDMPDVSGGRDSLALGLGPEHIPDLIRLATDEKLRWEAADDDPALWAPIHAWVALGQLRAEAAVEPLLSQLRHVDEHDDDWAGEELPRVFGMIGPAAIPALAAYLTDNRRGLWARVAAASGLKEIGQRRLEARAECAAALTRTLEQFADNDPALNGAVVSDLIDLKAVEAAPVIEQAFAVGRGEGVGGGRTGKREGKGGEGGAQGRTKAPPAKEEMSLSPGGGRGERPMRDDDYDDEWEDEFDDEGDDEFEAEFDADDDPDDAPFNPIYAGFGKWAEDMDEEAWIEAAGDKINEDGARAYLRRMLRE